MRRLLSIFAIVFFLGYLVWPYGTLLRFYLALKAEDAAQVERMVHWPSVKASIEQEINQGGGTYLTKAFIPSGSGGSTKLKLSYDSLSIANDIAAQLATPKSFIFLFKHPDKISCILHISGMSAPTNLADCEIKDNDADGSDTNSSGFKGPNFLRIYEKTYYLFFTDPFTFKFDVQHEDMRIALTFARVGFGWELVAMEAD